MKNGAQGLLDPPGVLYQQLLCWALPLSGAKVFGFRGCSLGFKIHRVRFRALLVQCTGGLAKR